MTHHQFGTVAGDETTGGVFEIGAAVLVDEWTTVAVDTIAQGQRLPIVTVQLSGRVNKSGDTFQGVFMCSLLDLGGLVRGIYEAVERIGTDEAMSDFKVGLAGGTP